ncbi:MAG: dihydropyrimidinase [Lachnospiraceae bacterium]|nr:dihydropyrimidinase [Lachnospiraceae bacterium]
MKTLIKDGTIVRSDRSFKGSVLIDGEKIARIYEGDAPDENAFDTVVDASGKLVFPGFIDAHTHFDLHVAGTVTIDDFYSGTRAAIAGGTTTIIDFGTQYHGETLMQGLQNWKEMASAGTSCDYGIHMTITEWNEEVCRECETMMEEGVSTFKLYMTYDTRVDDDVFYKVLKRLKEVHGITGVHCENDGLIAALRDEYASDSRVSKVSSHYLTRPPEAEAEAVNRLLYIAEQADVPVIVVHLTNELALQEIRAARKRGRKVFAETCPQYLLLTDDVYELPGFEGAKYVCAPPIRKRSDVEALWEALKNGEIQTVSTDHCSFTTEQKRLGTEDFRKIPGGVPGVETRVPLIYTEGVSKGRISREDMCRALSENPARLYGLYPQKGVIQEGADADIVILDPDVKRVISAETQVSKSDYAPFEGYECACAVEKVYLRGTLSAEDGKVVCENRGKFLKRNGYGETI